MKLIQCFSCRQFFLPVRLRWVTADGSSERKKPCCQDCQEDFVRGLGRQGAAMRKIPRGQRGVGRWGKLQFSPGTAYREYDP